MSTTKLWAPIEEFPEYEVSTWGRVRRIGGHAKGVSYVVIGCW